MLDFLLKLIGVESQTSGREVDDVAIHNMHANLKAKERQHYEKGISEADECIQEGLNKGSYARLSTFERRFRKDFPNEHERVMQGFKKRMKQACDDENIVGVELDEKEVVFFHIDYQEKFRELFE